MSRRWKGRGHVRKEVAVVASIDGLRLLLRILGGVIRGVLVVLVTKETTFWESFLISFLRRGM